MKLFFESLSTCFRLHVCFFQSFNCFLPFVFEGQRLFSAVIMLLSRACVTWEGYSNRFVSGSADLTLFRAISTLLVTNY